MAQTEGHVHREDKYTVQGIVRCSLNMSVSRRPYRYNGYSKTRLKGFRWELGKEVGFKDAGVDLIVKEQNARSPRAHRGQER